jgi:hypothetical protein
MEPRAKHLNTRKSLNNFKAWVSNPKEKNSRGLFKKGTNPLGMLVGSPKECVSIAMK